MTTYRPRDWTDRHCGKYENREHQLLDRRKSGEDVIAAMGVVSDVIDDSICSGADAEAFTSIDTTKAEGTAVECAFVPEEGSVEQQDGREP